MIPTFAQTEAGDCRLLHADVAGLTPIQRWAHRRNAETQLAWIIESGRDHVIVGAQGWAMYASDWLRSRISALRAP